MSSGPRLTWLLFKYHSGGHNQHDPLCTIMRRIVAINLQGLGVKELNRGRRRRAWRDAGLPAGRRTSTDPLPCPNDRDSGHSTASSGRSDDTDDNAVYADPSSVYEDPGYAQISITDASYGQRYAEAGNVV